jgi:ankyrin repeat protein
MRLLVKAGADTRLTTQDGTTVLIAAANSGVPEAVKVALDLGCDINAVTRSGQTAMHAAVLSPKPDHINDVVQLLADNGARLDVKDVRGRTPLMYTKLRTIDKTTDLLEKLIAARAPAPNGQ